MARRYSVWCYVGAFGLSLACGASEDGAPVDEVATPEIAADQGEPATDPGGVLPPASITDTESESESTLVGADPGGATVEGIRGPVVAAFPAPSGTCRMSFPVPGGTDSQKVSWDERSGRLQTEYEIPGQPAIIDYWVLDTGGRPLEERSSTSSSSIVRTYDANGGVTSLGVDAPATLWWQSNEYDLQGRLVSYVRSYVDGVNGVASDTGTFEYAGALLMRISGHRGHRDQLIVDT